MLALNGAQGTRKEHGRLSIQWRCCFTCLAVPVCVRLSLSFSLSLSQGGELIGPRFAFAFGFVHMGSPVVETTVRRACVHDGRTASDRSDGHPRKYARIANAYGRHRFSARFGCNARGDHRPSLTSCPCSLSLSLSGHVRARRGPDAVLPGRTR